MVGVRMIGTTAPTVVVGAAVVVGADVVGAAVVVVVVVVAAVVVGATSVVDVDPTLIQPVAGDATMNDPSAIKSTGPTVFALTLFTVNITGFSRSLIGRRVGLVRPKGDRHLGQAT